MIGPVNNVLCKFSCLDSVTKATYFKASVAAIMNMNCETSAAKIKGKCSA